MCDCEEEALQGSEGDKTSQTFHNKSTLGSGRFTAKFQITLKAIVYIAWEAGFWSQE